MKFSQETTWTELDTDCQTLYSTKGFGWNNENGQEIRKYRFHYGSERRIDNDRRVIYPSITCFWKDEKLVRIIIDPFAYTW